MAFKGYKAKVYFFIFLFLVKFIIMFNRRMVIFTTLAIVKCHEQGRQHNQVGEHGNEQRGRGQNPQHGGAYEFRPTENDEPGKQYN